MEIRKFYHDDIAGITDLINTELGYDISCQDVKAQILQMQEDKNYRIYVAVEDERIVGFIGLQIGIAFEITGKIMRIIALAVAHEQQGQGIGGSLIQAAERYANEQEVSTMLVNSGLNRKDAHRFYERHAFYQKGYSFCKRLS